MLISVTMLSEYLYCPRKLFLKKVLKMEEAPSAPMIKGTIRHQVYDFFNKKEESVVEKIQQGMLFEEVLQFYKNAYFETLKTAIISNKTTIKQLNLSMKDLFHQAWPFLVYDSMLRAKNVYDYAKAHNVWQQELWNSLTPKLFSEVSARSEKLRLKGIIDVVEDHSEFLVPVEIKTGKVPRDGVWPGHKVQVGAYLMLLEEQKPVGAGKVRYVEEDVVRPVVLNPFLRLEVSQLVTSVVELLVSREPPGFVQNRNKCSSCPFQSRCYDQKFMAERLNAL